MKLVVLCDDADGPVVRHRFRACQPALKAAGFDDVRYAEIPKRLVARLALFRTLGDADVVVLVRKLFTWAELKALRRSVKRLVYDFDDAVMYRDPFRGEPVSHVRRRRFRHTVRTADLVLAGNEYLLALAAEDAPGAKRMLAATPIDTDRYGPEPGGPTTGFRIGWIGSRATRGYLSMIEGALHRVVRERPETVVAVMADAPPSQLDGLPVEFTPWSTTAEHAFLESLHAGLMPLSDDPFSRGKCGFKLLQYMACCVPAIASPVGVNVEMCADGAGWLASNEDEWVEALLEIAGDQIAAWKRATVAMSRVDERWSARVLAPRMASALAECART